MRGHQRQAPRLAAQGERGAAARRRCAGGGDAGADAEADAVCGEMLHLFGRAAKDRGVAALQAHDALARLGGGEEEVVDAFLRLAVAAGAFADADPLDALGDEVEDAGADEGVVEDDLGSGDQLFGLAGEEVRVARPCADQPDFTGGDHLIRLHEASPAEVGRGCWRVRDGRTHNWCPRRSPCRWRARRPGSDRGWRRRSG